MSKNLNVEKMEPYTASPVESVKSGTDTTTLTNTSDKAEDIPSVATTTDTNSVSKSTGGKEHLGDIRTAALDTQAAKDVAAPQSDSEPATKDQPSSQDTTSAQAVTITASSLPTPVKKARKLTQEKIDEYAADLTERAKAGQFPDATIPFEHAKLHYNVSKSVMNEVMLRAILEHGLTGYKFDYTPLVPPKEENECFLNDRFMIMIGKIILDGFNEKLSPEKQLKKNDKFIASFTGDEIILTLKR